MTLGLGISQSSSVPPISHYFNQTEDIHGAPSAIRYMAEIKAVVHRPVCVPPTMLKYKQ